MTAKISAMTAAAAALLTHEFEVNQGGATKKVTGAQINTLMSAAQVLWKKTGANMNSTADQALTKVGTFTSFIITAARLVNPSTSLTTAAGGVYTDVSKGGDALVANTQIYTGASAAGAGQAMTLAALGAGLRADAALYLALTMPQGGAATADLYMLGIVIS